MFEPKDGSYVMLGSKGGDFSQCSLDWGIGTDPAVIVIWELLVEVMTFFVGERGKVEPGFSITFCGESGGVNTDMDIDPRADEKGLLGGGGEPEGERSGGTCDWEEFGNKERLDEVDDTGIITISSACTFCNDGRDCE